MRCVYYDCICDSHELFRDREIAVDDDNPGSLRQIPDVIEKALIKDLANLYPDTRQNDAESLGESLLPLVELAGRNHFYH